MPNCPRVSLSKVSGGNVFKLFLKSDVFKHVCMQSSSSRVNSRIVLCEDDIPGATLSEPLESHNIAALTQMVAFLPWNKSQIML